MTDNAWGRVAEDGSVFVRTAHGERQVGSWQAGSPDEALAFYTRRYQNAVVELDLLDKRLKAGGADPESAIAAIGRLRAQIETPAMVGDLEALGRRLDSLMDVVEERRARIVEERHAARAEAVARREAVVAEAEGLATSTAWKAAGDRFRALLDDWKALPKVDRRTEQALWKRFSAARSAFDKSRRAHFATLDAQRQEAVAAKEKLIKEAEALSSSTEWGPTSAKYRQLMDRWKAAGRASRTDEDALWARFRAAQDAFFSARNAADSERDGKERENLQRKSELADAAEALLPVTPENLDAARTAFRGINEQWESIGHVPRGDRPALEARMRKVEQAIRSVEDEKWRRSNPEARARAQRTVDQLETSLAALRRDLAAAEESGRHDKATEIRASIEAREGWLAEAQRALAEFSG